MAIVADGAPAGSRLSTDGLVLTCLVGFGTVVGRRADLPKGQCHE